MYTDGAGDMYALCGSDADARQCPIFHFHDGRVKAAFTLGAQILLAYRTTKPREQASDTATGCGRVIGLVAECRGFKLWCARAGGVPRIPRYANVKLLSRFRPVST